ncbi:MAG: cytochrome c oxidase accessory protein CcoG [Kordiimonas sp.]|nr:cytochrome c oxidase accessory protein CcoG [Kordiimonas sp.]|tara:strand:+ start:1777 stop:3288 length:1512 start_codon:yes stop_codon:yes gene_type:complete
MSHTQQDVADPVDQEQIIPAPNVDRIEVEPVNKKEERSLYKKREPIYPKRAKGLIRKIKWWVMGITLGIYYITPWLRWERAGSAPDQAVLIDFPGRRFYFFFIEIWPQEVYYITGLLILAGIGLFLVTSVAGRVWCGYTCPQTVWVDLYIAVERFFEGDRNARIKLASAPFSFSKLAKKVGKHVVWLLIAIATGGAWVFYFADAPTLLTQIFSFDAPMVAYTSIGLLAFTTYLLGGFAREQVCTYMCPWPRIQAAMVDEESLNVSYRVDRGEPRAPHKKGESWDGRGDCVQCRQCVAVCPMGIDIRDGAQLECIHCGLCIDACNEVMEKVNRPKWLIAYDTDGNIARRAKGLPEKYRPIRTRTVSYSLILLLVGAIMLYALLNRENLDVNVLRDRNPYFVLLSDGSIRNGYTVKLLNKQHKSVDFVLSIEGLTDSTIKVIGIDHYDTSGNPIVNVAADSLRSLRVYVSTPRVHVGKDSMGVNFKAKEVGGPAEAIQHTTFKGP